MTTPGTFWDGWERQQSSITSAMKQSAAAELTARLVSDGWIELDTLYIKRLTTTVALPSLKNIPCHVSIAKEHIENVAESMLVKGVDGAGKAVTVMLSRVAYHVTFERYDKYGDKNPRYFSKDGWTNASDVDVDAEDLQLALTEAAKLLGRKK